MERSSTPRLVLCILVALAVSAFVAAAAAAANPTWNNLSGEELTSKVAIKGKDVGGLVFEDSGTGVSVKCEIAGEGGVGSGSADEVTSISASKCATVKGSCGSPKAKAVNLPWATELYEKPEETEVVEVRDRISNAAKNPGWEVECTVLGIKVKDVCTGEDNVEVENVSGGVDSIFDSRAPKANCSVGGAGTGVVLGTELNEGSIMVLPGRPKVLLRSTTKGALPFDFGKTLVEGLPVKEAFEVTSGFHGDKITISSVKLTGDPAFEIKKDGCVEAIVGSGINCKLEVSLTPNRPAGSYYSTQLEVTIEEMGRVGDKFVDDGRLEGENSS